MARATIPDRSHRSLRVLMMIHTPWSAELGGPRAQMEIGEELTAMGDRVEKFSYEDAFPGGQVARPARGPRWARTLAGYAASNRSFALRARRFVLAHGHRFDVIDANQTDLPFAKSRLAFSGLLVARSAGLIPVYAEFERWAARRWPEPASLRHFAHGSLTWPGRRRRLRDARRSLEHADLINVPNRDELEILRAEPELGAKAIWLPLGVSARRRAELARAAAGAEERLAARTVVFIGTWNSRKGSRDWPRIAALVREREPAARFLFLGTGLHREAVLREIPEALRACVEVVPSFEAPELPARLARATVGAFPAYLEGFGLSVLEKLAAGLPTVTYDAPGPRDMMSRLAHPSMVPVGDVEAFAGAVVAVLGLSPESYAQRSEDARRAAAWFDWGRIARETRAAYLGGLETIGRVTR